MMTMGPIPGESPFATKLWRATVEAADLHCECRGQCGERHGKDPLGGQKGRCDYVVSPGTPWRRLLVLEVAPQRHAAVCPDCFDGLARIERRLKKRVVPQEEVLF